MRSGLNGSYGTPKNFARADRGNLDLELLDEHHFDVDSFLARRPGRELELRGGDHGVAHQKVVLRLEDLRLLALLERNGQRLAEFRDPLLGQLSERHAGSVVDQLDDAHEFAAPRLRNGRDQHLLGAITGALVDFLQEAQVRVVRLELAFVVHVLQIEHPLRQSDVARDRVFGYRQLQILEGVEAGLDLGDDGLFVLAHGIDRQPVGVEEGTNVGADFQHDFVHVARGVDLVGDGLEILLKRQPAVDVRSSARMRLQNRAHRQSTLRFITTKYPDNQLLYHCSALAADPGQGVFHTPAPKTPAGCTSTRSQSSENRACRHGSDCAPRAKLGARGFSPSPHAPPFVSPQSPPASTNARYPR